MFRSADRKYFPPAGDIFSSARRKRSAENFRPRTFCRKRHGGGGRT